MQRYPTENGLAVPIHKVGYEMMPESSRRTQGHQNIISGIIHIRGQK